MRVALFVSCVSEAWYPRTGEAVAAVLERLGHEVVFESAQTCCGQMHWTSGYHREAEGLARRFTEVFAGHAAVVTPSASCAATVRRAYPRLVGGEPPPVHEFAEFLTDVLDVTDVGAWFPHRVAYQPTCHALRSLRLGDRAERLLRAVRGLELAELGRAEECCGFGGTFALKNADSSVAMVADKVRHVRETGADVVCAVDHGCLTHLGGALSRLRSGVRTVHLAEILASTEAS
ncbi:(Fe-S)-binding protein [Actinocorallia lasiicapitis]